jgi:hypothetical protein
MTMLNTDPVLYLEVIGGGFKGESIIIKLPSGHWGIIDCYSPNLTDPKYHPVIQRLKQLEVTELEFVALTHPLELASSAVKVSHHGSTTGYCKGLWNSFALDHDPVAVV